MERRKEREFCELVNATRGEEINGLYLAFIMNEAFLDEALEDTELADRGEIFDTRRWYNTLNMTEESGEWRGGEW